MPAHDAPLTPAQRSRYARHLILDGFGEAAQERLVRSRVLVVGAGGLGSPVCLYLAAAGVGTLTIADDDTVDVSNLQRQIIHTTARAGLPKVDSAAEAIRALNQEVDVEPRRMRVDAATVDGLVADHDLVVDCSDGIATKYLLNDACVRAGTPLVHAGVVGYAGQVMAIVPGEGPCYRCLFPDEPEAGSLPTSHDIGVFGPAVGVVGSMEAAEALKLLTGVGESLSGRLLTVDTRTMAVRRIDLPAADPACPVCGSGRAEGSGAAR
ncbi:HesA/MoeB/ThiF family protein [Bifidobacterium pullorum subsp. saeculare]|uniref:HesA/MoeB/ThiF family protein n=2 Tax=Bifidobacterium pullorum TaxID=78448 RepID=A0A938WXJ2_9BIFI|nr:HesA/MoeB/ThiF family protein [Bifidobacterium pullorum subsp. saeculare]